MDNGGHGLQYKCCIGHSGKIEAVLFYYRYRSKRVRISLIIILLVIELTLLFSLIQELLLSQSVKVSKSLRYCEPSPCI